MSKSSQVTLAAEPNWPCQQLCEHGQCDSQHPVVFNFFMKKLKTRQDCCCIRIAALVTRALVFLREWQFGYSCLILGRGRRELYYCSSPSLTTAEGFMVVAILLSSGGGHEACLMPVSFTFSSHLFKYSSYIVC